MMKELPPLLGPDGWPHVDTLAILKIRMSFSRCDRARLQAWHLYQHERNCFVDHQRKGGESYQLSELTQPLVKKLSSSTDNAIAGIVGLALSIPDKKRKPRSFQKSYETASDVIKLIREDCGGAGAYRIDPVSLSVKPTAGKSAFRDLKRLTKRYGETLHFHAAYQLLIGNISEEQNLAMSYLFAVGDQSVIARFIRTAFEIEKLLVAHPKYQDFTEDGEPVVIDSILPDLSPAVFGFDPFPIPAYLRNHLSKLTKSGGFFFPSWTLGNQLPIIPAWTETTQRGFACWKNTTAAATWKT